MASNLFYREGHQNSINQDYTDQGDLPANHLMGPCPPDQVSFVWALPPVGPGTEGKGLSFSGLNSVIWTDDSLGSFPDVQIYEKALRG